MARTRPAAGGGRWVEVDPERLPGWLDGFRRRHGDVAVNPTGTTLLVAFAVSLLVGIVSVSYSAFRVSGMTIAEALRSTE